MKSMIDAYGVGVRAGTITPTAEDEKLWRDLMDLPDMSSAVTNAWKEDGGFRRPITLKVEEPAAPAAKE